MKKSTHDDSLIISRLEQKELGNIKFFSSRSEFFPLVTTVLLKPIFGTLPINIGLHLHLIGNKIINARVDRGYYHQAMEQTIEVLSPHDAIIAIARINIKAPLFYQVTLMNAYLSLLDEKPIHAPRMLTSAMEIVRAYHHLNVVQSILLCAELDTLATFAGECELFLKQPFTLFSRIFSTSSAPPSMSSVEMSVAIAEGLQRVEELSHAINLEEQLVKRLSKKGIITQSLACSLGLSGHYIRGNRQYYDLRNRDLNLYETPIKVSAADGGDAYARFTLRIAEIIASLTYVQHQLSVLDNFSPLTIESNFLVGAPTDRYAVSEVEGPEGIIKASIFVNDTEQKVVRLRIPAFYIAQAIPRLLRQSDLRDLTILLASLGITAEEIDK